MSTKPLRLYDIKQDGLLLRIHTINREKSFALLDQLLTVIGKTTTAKTVEG